MAETSVRSNSVPMAGATATTTGQASPLLPSSEGIRAASEAFMESSDFNVAVQNTVGLIPGSTSILTVQSVGLGSALDLFVSGTISFTNTGAAAQTISLSPEFPYSLLKNVLVQVNGQTVIVSCSGYSLLTINAKRYKGFYGARAAGGGTSNDSQLRCSLDPSIAYVTAGANVTLNNSSNTGCLTGVSSITVAANSTGVLNVGMYLKIPFTLRDDILLGMIPLQNNSVNFTVSFTAPTILGTNANSPCYVSGGVPATLSNAANALSIKPTYNFWAIPTPNNPQAYGYFVSNSYILTETSNTVSTTGSQALKYQMPNNYLLASLLLTLRDSSGNLLNIPNSIDNPYLNYNNTAQVDKMDIQTKMAKQSIFYEAPATPIGQYLYDMTDVSYLANGTNTAKWLNMYLANNPTFIADVQSGISVPISYSVLREQIVPAQVQLV